MRKGQMGLTGFVISFLVLVLIVVLLPVIRVFIDGTLGTGQFETGTEKWIMYFMPTLMVVAAIIGFFVWNSVVSSQ